MPVQRWTVINCFLTSILQSRNVKCSNYVTTEYFLLSQQHSQHCSQHIHCHRLDCCLLHFPPLRFDGCVVIRNGDIQCCEWSIIFQFGGGSIRLTFRPRILRLIQNESIGNSSILSIRVQIYSFKYYVFASINEMTAVITITVYQSRNPWAGGDAMREHTDTADQNFLHLEEQQRQNAADLNAGKHY